jgi:hypothetical protein
MRDTWIGLNLSPAISTHSPTVVGVAFLTRAFQSSGKGWLSIVSIDFSCRTKLSGTSFQMLKVNMLGMPWARTSRSR